ncbi:hypothetical protein BDZ89DRAFT_1151260 [Hymenopellis radicata]|nr:hypothetical protein BDZ89DRAFT_1151260 [Hymenopellis radicata]
MSKLGSFCSSIMDAGPPNSNSSRSGVIVDPSSNLGDIAAPSTLDLPTIPGKDTVLVEDDAALEDGATAAFEDAVATAFEDDATAGFGFEDSAAAFEDEAPILVASREY